MEKPRGARLLHQYLS